jgi:hypothetical protein
MAFKRIAAMCVVLLSGAADGQQVPDACERDLAVAEVADALRLRLDAAKNALREHDHEGAVRHFANALWWCPGSASVLLGAFEAAAPSEDARTLWAHAIGATSADERGALDPSGRMKEVLALDPAIAKIASARAEAAVHLAAFVKELKPKDPDREMLARWAAGAALELLAPAPALRRRHAAVFNQAVAPALPDYRPVLLALKSVMDKALGEQRPELAIRAAQCLLGLASQSRFHDLKGPKPPALEPVAMTARAGLARAREQLEGRRKGAILTIDELEAMSKEEREAFTRAHCSLENPAITMSPNGRYRIETSCGHATLLGVARTIELHHGRLIGYFGQDPFVSEPGLVRVVPESSGLEAEGTPYWWAGGFQSGSVTTVKFSCGTIGGLGRGLTHELTHRFDGALNSGIPAWLAEGRAVWTGGAYGAPADRGFVPNHASFGTVEDAFIKGYGDEERLRKLVEGTIEDYRHNYTAGYALYLFLASWKHEGAPLYRDRLGRFERGCKEKGGNALSWFTACFCDGKAGRPKDFKAFAGEFAAFVKGFYWQSPAPWTSAYTQKLPDGGHDPFVYDAPTWHQARDRAEPVFGQDQARIAGDLLLEAGRPRDALAAYAWSLAVDEWQRRVVGTLGRLLDDEQRDAAAWALRSEAARRFGDPPPPGAPPGDLGRAAGKIAAVADLLAAAQKTCVPGRPLVAAALAADQARLASRCGAKALAPVKAPPADGPRLHPLDEPPRALGLCGWEEDDLTGYEERRVKDLWYEVAEGHLHVGRSRPREGTGTMDRAAHQRDAFVRTREWFAAGRYVISARIQCNTSFTSGSVVVGWARRDRNVRLGFSGGDFLYSIGAKEDKTEFDSIHAHLHGLRERDGPLWGSVPGRGVRFTPPTSTFELRILVDGPEVRAFVNDELIGVYHTTDGQAVEGYVGFAAGQGAYLVASPTVERRDRSRAAGADPAWPVSLDLSRAGTQTRAEILNAAAAGFQVGSSGAVVLWIPDLGTQERPALAIDYAGLVTSTAAGLDAALKEGEHPTRFVLCLPASLDEPARKGIESDVAFHCERGSTVLTHRQRTPLSTRRDADDAPLTPAPSVLFLDPQGVVRVVERFDPGQRELPHALRQWLSVFEAIASAQRPSTGGKAP